MDLFDGFEGILYINLPHRKDRLKQIRSELQTIGLTSKKVFRIEGIYDELNGARGCVLSHIKALEHALKNQWKQVLILEDDCLFLKNGGKIEDYLFSFFQHFGTGWDVFFLGGELKMFEPTTHPEYLKVQFSLRSHAYGVNGPYLQILRDHFFSTYESMKEDLFVTQSLSKALDRRWVDLQLQDRWYIGINPIVKQRRSYSDVEKSGKPCR